MKKRIQLFSLIFFGISIFQGCTSTNSESKKPSSVDKEILVQEINQLEETLQAKADQKIDRKLAEELIEKSKTYAEAFPEDELSPAYLFRSGNVAVGLGSFKDAVGYFETIHQKYVSYERAPDALFLEGFTYENHLKDIENAKRCYNDFLTRFPENKLADQVRVVLANIGKSPEELVKSFQNK